VLAGGERVLVDAQQHVGNCPGVTIHNVPTNDAWCRDHGPIFLSTSDHTLPPALLHWGYNAWGGKYPPFDFDCKVPQQIADLLGQQRFVPGMILEGGAIEGDGRGTILTTESCLLNPNRNPGWSRTRIEQQLVDYLGARRVIWLRAGDLVGDDTDGHIDQLARFANPNTIVVAWESNKQDVNYEPLARNFQQLSCETVDANGQPYRLEQLPLPSPIYVNGQRLPASYCNFLIANQVVLVPEFDDPNDRVAQDKLAALFPDRAIVGIPCRAIILGLGAIHCLTQQQPLAVLDT
jgi:agmatine deiminase